jgi:hypothetical protein
MHKMYEPARALADRFIHDRVVTRIWDRNIRVWQAAPGSADAQSIETRLGWLDVAVTMAPELERIESLAAAVKAEGARRVPARDGRQQPVRRGAEGRLRRRRRLPTCTCSTRPTSDDHAPPRRCLTPDHTWFIVASKSGGTVEVASMERFFWGSDAGGARRGRGPPFRRHHGPGYGARRARGRARLPRDLHQPRRHRRAILGAVALRPRARGAHRRDGRELLAAGTAMAEGCRQENHANAGADARRVHRRHAPGRPRQAHARPPAFPRRARPVDRTARRREHRQARQGGAARSSTSRSARRRVRTGPGVRRLSTERDAPDAAGWPTSPRRAIPCSA